MCVTCAVPSGTEPKVAVTLLGLTGDQQAKVEHGGQAVVAGEATGDAERAAGHIPPPASMLRIRMHVTVATPLTPKELAVDHRAKPKQPLLQGKCELADEQLRQVAGGLPFNKPFTAKVTWNNNDENPAETVTF